MRKRKKGLGPVDWLLLAAFVAGLAVACALLLETGRETAAYTSLAGEVSGEDGAAATIDWDALRAQNPDVAAWVKVDGTPIDYPVASPRAGDADDFYLHHDLWRNYSLSGCPYLDARCDADGAHALVYGHHVGHTDQMFSPIYDAYGQARFNEIGSLTWSTPARGDVELKPAFAMSVDKSYGPIQTFDFADADDLRAWLSTLSAAASARSADCDELCAAATRAVTLVTCSSNRSGQRARTLVVFVA